MQTNTSDTQIPSTVEQNSVATTETPPTEGLFRRLNKRIFVILGILISLAVVGAGVFVYQTIYLSPEKVVERSLDKMQDLKTFGYDGSISLTYASDKAGENLLPLFSANTFSFNFKGALDVKDGENAAVDLTFDVKSGSAPFGKAQFRSFGKVMYLYINDLSGLETIFGPGGEGFFDDITKTWIKLDSEELEKLSNREGETPEIDPEEFTKLLEENNPLKVAEGLPSEKINDQEMYHYGFSVDKDKLKTFLKKYQELAGDNGELGPTAEENLNKSVDKMEFKGGEVWIGKQDKYFHKVVFGITSKSDDGSTTFGVDFIFTMKDHGKAVSIEEPSDFMTSDEFEEKIQELFAPMYQQYQPELQIY